MQNYEAWSRKRFSEHRFSEHRFSEQGISVSVVAELFPLIAFLAISVVVVYVLATRNKLALGSQSAGPVLAIVQDVHGLKSQAWDVTSIAANLRGNPEHTLTMVRGYCHTVGLGSSQTLGTSEHAVEILVDRLERQLELGPLTVDRQSPIDHSALSR